MSNSKTSKQLSTASKVFSTKQQLMKYEELTRLMDNKEFHADMHEALDHHFEVLVMATMSAGKSTLLNAMLGIDLLPSCNEACTSIVYRLEDQDGMAEFQCRAVVGETITDWQPATLEALSGWNSGGICSLVDVAGDMPFIKNLGARLVLYDTPGPNNARDERHAQVLRNIMHNQEYGLVIFMLSATNVSTTDERILLEELLKLYKKSGRSKKEIIFVLNKVDEIDEGNGESLQLLMSNVKSYLKDVGFSGSTIIPTMAHAAKLFRMAARGEHLTRHQRLELSSQLDILKEDPFRLLKITQLDSEIHNEINNGIKGKGHSLLHLPTVINTGSSINVGNQVITKTELESAVYSTGIHTIETILEKMISKKALPETMKRVSAVMRKHGAKLLNQWLK